MKILVLAALVATVTAGDAPVGSDKCTWGPSYWCQSVAHAESCGAGALSHCQRVWAANDAPSKRGLLGSKRCTWGPSYWCASIENAQECAGSADYCKAKVWVGDHPLAKITKRSLGSEKCTRGPGYWCASVANAKKCHSEAHCREKVWVGSHPLAKLTNPIPEQNAKPVDNGNCALCEMIATEVLSKLKDNATEAEVIGAFEGLCDLVPKTESCKAFVDKYGKQLWDEFVQNADVQTLCQLVGFCSQEFLVILREGKVALLYLKGKTRDIGCDACSAGMTLLKKEVLANEKAIEAQLEQTCSVLPVDKDECHEILDSVFESAVTFFESYTAEQLCQMVGLCASLETLLGPGPVMNQQMKLGKDNDCQNGPAYWCASSSNAEKCNMVEFCSKNGQPTVF